VRKTIAESEVASWTLYSVTQKAGQIGTWDRLIEYPFTVIEASSGKIGRFSLEVTEGKLIWPDLSRKGDRLEAWCKECKHRQARGIRLAILRNAFFWTTLP